MITAEDKLWDTYSREKDPIEKAYLLKEMYEKGVDLLNHYYEECQFCGRDVALRKMQQVSIFEKDMSHRMQELRNGALLFRCHECRDRKRNLAIEIKKHQRMLMLYVNKEGVVTNFTSYEICQDLIEGFRKKIELMNCTIDGRILSHLDDVTDYQEADTNESIAKRISHENVAAFLSKRKKDSYLKWTGK